MTVRFQIAHGVQQVPQRELLYRRTEHSFDMEPPPTRNFTSVLIDDLNIEIDDSGKVVSVWGLCPYTRWVEGTLIPPSAAVGTLFVKGSSPLARGVSVQVNRDKYLPTYVDRQSGWVKIEARRVSASAVRVFPGVIFEIDEHGDFCALWLRPRAQVLQAR
jgi:hypothetical protein